MRIPIDRAMELIVQRGLPVHPEGASSDTEELRNEEFRGADLRAGKEAISQSAGD